MARAPRTTKVAWKRVAAPSRSSDDEGSGAGGPARRYAIQHAAGADVFVHVRPVNVLAAADDLVLSPRRGRCVREPPRPGEGYADRAAAGEVGGNQVVGHLYRPNPWVAATRLRRSAHAKPPECGVDAPRQCAALSSDPVASARGSRRARPDRARTWRADTHASGRVWSRRCLPCVRLRRLGP